MSTNVASLIPKNLANVFEQIRAREDLPRRRRDEMASAVQVVRRLRQLPLSEISADPEALRTFLGQITAASASLSPGRWRNVKSLFRAALTLTGVTVTGARSRNAMSPEWLEL